LCFEGGRDLSIYTQIRVIGPIELEICSEMLRNLSEKLRAKFLSTTLGYTVVRISCLAGAFAGILELGASPLVDKQLRQKDKRRKPKGQKKPEQPERLGQNVDFCACPSKNVINASRKEGILSCCKCLSE